MGFISYWLPVKDETTPELLTILLYNLVLFWIYVCHNNSMEARNDLQN
jgi:hypothetical protein